MFSFLFMISIQSKYNYHCFSLWFYFILGYLVTTKVTMSSTTTSLLSSSLSTTSDPTSKPSTTYSTSTTPSPLLAKCNDSGVVLEKSLMCVLPYYVNISMAKDKEAFCRQKLSISLIWIFLKESRKLHIVTENTYCYLNNYLSLQHCGPDIPVHYG